jgi:hypothetical protein
MFGREAKWTIHFALNYRKDYSLTVVKIYC